MSRWYWTALACGVLFGVTWLMPEYVNTEGGGVYAREVGRGWNWRDPDGNPLHDDKGNRIKPNWVRTVALGVFAAGAVGFAAAGWRFRKRPHVTTTPAGR